MKKITHVVIVLLSIYLGYIFTSIFTPKVQFFIDLANYENAGTAEVFVYNEEYRSLMPEADGRYSTVYEVYKNPINISFSVVEGAPSAVQVNGKDFTSVKKISDYTREYVYNTSFVLKTDIANPIFYPVLILFSIVFILTFEFVLNRILLKKGNRLDKLIYSKSGLESIGKKAIVASYIVTLISLLIYHGIDLKPLTESVKLSASGIDIYQLFACLNKYKDIELFLWQYEGMLLAFYKLVSCISYLPLNFDPNSYHWGYTILYKFVNITLLNLTAISLVSFMIDHNIISKEKSRNVYLWSVLNPVTFYVSVIFIQFDTLPLYFITLGLLLLDNIEENSILPFMLVAFGIACKLPMLMLMPVIGMIGLYLLLKSRGDKLKKLILYFAFFGAILMVIFLAPRLVNAPIAVAYRGMKATQRMWWTTIQYAPSVFLFVSVLVLELFTLLNYTKFNLSVSVKDLLQNSFLIIGTIIFAFSFSLMSTPSIYIVAMPAFAFMYAKHEDNLQRFIFGFGALLVMVQVMCTSMGDITSTSLFWGGKAIFSEIEKMYSGTSTGTQISSILYTVSNSAMLAYAIIFFNAAGKHFKKKNIGKAQ